MEMVHHHAFEGFDENEQLRIFFLPPSAPKIRMVGEIGTPEFQSQYNDLVRIHGGKQSILRKSTKRPRAVPQKTEEAQRPRRVPRDVLPLSLPPRGLSREIAAAYIGVSPSKFDELVRDGRMPKPKSVDARRIWDRHKVDAAFSALPDTDGLAENDARKCIEFKA